MRWNISPCAPRLVVVLIVYLLTSPLGFSQQSDAELGGQRGEADAIETPLLGSTFLMPWTFPMPVDPLFGRSSAYLDAYVQAYATWAASGNLVRSASGLGRGSVVRGDRALAKALASGPPAPLTDAELGRKRASAEAHPEAKWLGLGILLPGVALIMPLALPVRVPQNTLIGRSSEYLDAYLDTYVAKVRFGNFLWAAFGTGIDVAVVGAIALEIAAAEGCAELAGPTLQCLGDPEEWVKTNCIGPIVAGACSTPF